MNHFVNIQHLLRLTFETTTRQGSTWSAVLAAPSMFASGAVSDVSHLEARDAMQVHLFTTRCSSAQALPWPRS